MPKVSVIVPNYNHAKYLPKRIETILNQTYQDFEIILLDDCSTDNSKELIDAYAKTDGRIKVVLNDKNSGSPFMQWQRGLKLSSGKYIWIAESDDFASSCFLAILVEMLDSYPNVGIAYSQSWAVDEYNSITHSYVQWTDEIDEARWKSNFINNGKDEIRKYFCLKNTIPNASAVLFKKKYASTSEPLETTMRLSGDKVFWARILLQSDIAFNSSHYNYFRHHSNNARTKTKELEALIDNYRWLRWLKKNIDLPSSNLNKATSRIYTWSAGYSLKYPQEFFSLLKIHIKLRLDEFFYAKFLFFLVKELLYRSVRITMYQKN